MNQFFLVLRVIVANWKKAKGQLFFTILGIAIASTLWSSVDIVNNQTIKAQKRSIDLLQTAFKPIIIDKELPYVSQSDYIKLRLDGWLVNPVIRAPLKNSKIVIVGIDLLADGKKAGEALPRWEGSCLNCQSASDSLRRHGRCPSILLIESQSNPK